MAAFKLKLQIDQGATFRKDVVWETGTPPAPVDLTGCTARMQARDSVESTVVLLDLTTENGGIELGTDDGKVSILIDAEATADIVWSSAVYDLEIVFADGVTVRRLLSGLIVVSPEVTR